jgi:ketosteroid isomerase-like protein
MLNMKSFVVCALALTVTAAAPVLVSGGGPKVTDSGAVAAVTAFENDAIKAVLANDSAFYEKSLASDFTGGTSRGTWDTKSSMLADMKDTKNNKTTSQNLSDLKVRVHGDLAVATYTTTYDAVIQGQHYARTVLCTDALQQQNGVWKLMANHCSQAAK